MSVVNDRAPIAGDVAALVAALAASRLETQIAQRETEAARRDAAAARQDRDRLWQVCDQVKVIAPVTYSRAVAEIAARRAGKLCVHRRFPQR